MYPKNLSNKDETPKNEAAVAMPKNGPQEKQFLKGISESTTNWHKCIKAAKVVIASRVNQSLLNKFSETIIIDL